MKRIIRKFSSVHQGGMWKIAYADFITAMMVLFLLLWILGVTPKESLQGVADHFSKHILLGNGALSGSQSQKAFGVVDEADQSAASISEIDKTNILNTLMAEAQSADQSKYAQIVKDLQTNMAIDVTPEGLKLQIMETDGRPMFKPGTDELQAYVEQLLNIISKVINKMPNPVSITGHTASLRDPSSTNIDLWNLSILRANKAREYLSQKIHPRKIVQVSGKADMEPADKSNPYGAKNIRISIVLLNTGKSNNYYQNKVLQSIKNR